MSAPTIAWADPPPDGRTEGVERARSVRRDYAAIAAELRRNPQRWARVAECPGRSGANIARRMRHGITVGFRPAGAFEAECREVGGVTHVFARYVGQGSP